LRITSSVWVRRAPEVLSALMNTPTLIASSLATNAARLSGDDNAPAACPWTSTTGYLAFGTRCSAVTSVGFGR
jgi:hypothetical protein